jgi:Fe-S-cluster containining protein
VQDYIDTNKCTKCGGKCCNAIYLSQSEGGTRPDSIYFEEWLDQWEEEFRNSGAIDCGIKPNFDPSVVHMNCAESETMREKLKRDGINPNSCKYLGKRGCVLPRIHRPRVCNTYNCENAKWDARKMIKA